MVIFISSPFIFHLLNQKQGEYRILSVKKTVTIQDISCIGKCSLTVALPILSAMGIETAVLPTALLSTHTAFDGFFFHDLTKDILPITNHWKNEGFSFDSIYTGYLGSVEQVDIVRSFVKDFKSEGTLFIADPAMADEGKMYSGFNPSFASHMARLLEGADVILPNMTEASFLLGEDYKEGGYKESDIEKKLINLSKLGAKKVVLKGICFKEDQKTLKGVVNKIGNATYDSLSGRITWYFHEKINENFCGTGDVYASAFTGAIMRGIDFESAVSLSCDFVLEAIKRTMEEENYHTWCVDFEKALGWLMKRVGEL